MTRDEAAQLLNCSLSELAEILGVSTASVAQWGDKPIPPLRIYQVRDLVAGRQPLGLSKLKSNLNEIHN
ncbi:MULTISPECIES: helix-turn-helix domain-containing protein [Acinetobacter]|jgi:hypothetical protein|uniref:Ribonuclease D n=1 Tax=Acinetobacter lwoffii TaxID=28090 RepID=A0A6N1MJE4_ACILW|nr:MULTISPECIES: ribonuclease D [Acinetobacter]AWD69582.1 ribonuclease D [Acinetobacter schindleri]QKU20674.1 ribonuclease D [Acinetobacter lwoffii]